jgi:5-methyltetrahydropteroyltriglutamate--homocysteine methyltransferase
MILPTTTVGSFPKPDYLRSARTRFARGEIAAGELRRLERQATEEIVRLQEELGLDILVDGEMNRGDMATYFAEHLDGFRISGLVRSYGNRYYRKPVAEGPVRRSGPITVDWFLFAQGLTEMPMKAILTGPYTMMDWSFDEYYPSREHFAMAMAEALHGEVQDLEEAGARYIQIDEPAVSVRPEELDLAVRTMRVVTDGIRAKTITHICYGSFELIYPKMLELAVDQIDLELSNSEFDMLEHFRRTPFTKEIAAGVCDAHNHVVESTEAMATRIRRLLEVIPAERITVDPDCGLKTRTLDEARAKLNNMVAAVREVRNDVGKDET